MTAAASGLSLGAGLELSGMTFEELWIRQVAVGGDRGCLEVEAYVLGLLVADPLSHNMIAQAINEYFVERGGDHPVAYVDVDWQSHPKQS